MLLGYNWEASYKPSTNTGRSHSSVVYNKQTKKGIDSIE